MRIDELVLARLRRQTSLWLAREPDVRRTDDAEALRLLRAAGQRLEAALRLYSDYLPRVVQRARPALKPLLRSLGAVRDLDIRDQAFEEFGQSLTPRQRTILAPVRRQFHAEHSRLRSQALHALDAAGSMQRMERLQQSLSFHSSPHSRREQKSARTVASKLVRKRYRKLRKAADRLDAHSSNEDYHAVRRQVKKLRYAVESTTVLYGRPADKLLLALQKVQRSLGDQHDAYLVQQAVLGLARHPAERLPPEALLLTGRMAELQAEIANRARREFQKRYGKLRGKPWKRLRRALSAK